MVYMQQLTAYQCFLFLLYSSALWDIQIAFLRLSIQNNICKQQQKQQMIKSLLHLIPHHSIDIFQKNNLLKSSTPYYILPLIQLLGIFWFYTNAWFFLMVIYTILPMLDEVFSVDLVNPSSQDRIQLQKNDQYFKLALYASIITDWILFFKTMDYFTNMDFTFWNIINLVGLVFIFSNFNAIQFAVAHQLFHKQGNFYKIFGTLHMSKLLYMHFTYQHIYGHHKRVATPLDPASAQKGISLYQFFPKSFLGSYRSVYSMEKNIWKPFYLNYSVLSIVGAFLFTIAVFVVYPIHAGILFLISTFGSVFYLQAINYIEHYGLRRDKLANGEYEKVNIRHSWNAPHRFSNYLLFKLQRHSDHHQNSLKPYQTLVSLDESPHLPHGYSLIIFMSFFPSVWFSIMDPIVDEYKRLKNGRVSSEVIKKAEKDTMSFSIKLGGIIFVIWVVVSLFGSQ